MIYIFEKSNASTIVTDANRNEIGTLVDKRNRIISVPIEKIEVFADEIRELERDGYTIQWR